MNATDFLVGEKNDLQEDAVTLDWVEGNSDGQHIQDILTIEPGELKYDVLMGVGILRSMNGPSNSALRKTILMQLEADGYSVQQLIVDIENEKIEVDAERVS
jgi:hypothetical protein